MYSSSDRQPDDITESGNMVLHENVYIWKINLQKTLEISEMQRRELLNYTKELLIPRKDRIAICSSEECMKGFNF